MRTAVYVIGPESGPPVKIGFSSDPAARLSDLQVGSPSEIKFHLLCWLPNKWRAKLMEHRCHSLLTAAGCHIRGEWFNVTPLKAAKTIDCASIELDCEIIPHARLVEMFPRSIDPFAGHVWNGLIA